MVRFMNINLTDDRTAMGPYDNGVQVACSLCLRNGTCAGGAPTQPHANALLCAKHAGRFRYCQEAVDRGLKQRPVLLGSSTTTPPSAGPFFRRNFISRDIGIQ